MVQESLYAIIDIILGAKFLFLYGVWGDDFHKNFQILEKKMYFILLYLVFFVITAHETSKGSRNIRGFALIRAVLLCLVAREGTTQLTNHLILATTFSQMVSFWFYFTTSIPD